MDLKLRELEKGGWKEIDAFKPFLKALKGVVKDPRVGQCGTKYFETIPKLFLARFRAFFNKHVIKSWVSDGMKLHFMIGGQPELAQPLAKWLVDYKQVRDLDDRTEAEEDADNIFGYSFPNQDIKLDRIHTMSPERGDITINIKECMEFLTANVDREQILNGRFVRENWQLIQDLAEAPTVVNIFDKDTWFKDGEEHPLALQVWKKICPVTIHQQLTENYVQTMGHVSRTNVKEARRSNKVFVVSVLTRRAQRKAAEERHDVKRVQGRDKHVYFLNELDSLVKQSDKAVKRFGKDRYNRLLKRMKSRSDRASTVHEKEERQKFDVSLQKPLSRKFTELSGKADVTAHVGDGILFRMMTKKNGAETPVHAEIRKRKQIKFTKRQEKTFTIAEKRNLLRNDEMKVWAGSDKATAGIKLADVTYLKPQSNEMKAFGTVQRKVLNKEDGVEDEDDDDADDYDEEVVQQQQEELRRIQQQQQEQEDDD